MPERGRCFSMSNFAWANGSGREEIGGSRKKFSGRERRAKGRVRLHGARGSAELREVASGTATQGLWLRNGKEKWKSEISGKRRRPKPNPWEKNSWGS